MGFAFLVAGFTAFTQQPVSGKVTSSADGEPLSGVSIIVKGVKIGTSSDADGHFSLEVPDYSAVLVFSFVGFASQEIAVENQTRMEVQLREVAQERRAFATTALGIQRERRSLAYAVQDVPIHELSRARELNVINSLAGKAAGLSINRAGTGVGASARVVLRGNRSISGNSQPLYVVDGVPLGEDISQINPDDIDRVTVLTGANASALYGARGQNGAIIINTRKGRNTGRGLDIAVNTSLMLHSPLLLTNYQSVYGQGSGGVYAPDSETSWGPRMNGQTAAHWSSDPDRPHAEYPLLPQPGNVTDFFQTGHTHATTLAIHTGSEMIQKYFSYTFTDAAGIVPTNALTRHSMNLRLTAHLADKLALDAKVNYIRQNIDNQLAQGDVPDNPIRQAYRLPRNIRTSDIMRFEFTDGEGVRRQNYWNTDSNDGGNPYWTIHRNKNRSTSDRIIAFAAATLNLTNRLDLMIRSGIDRGLGSNRIARYDDGIVTQRTRDTQERSDALEWNSDFLFLYDRNLNERWSFDAHAGGSARKTRNSSADHTGSSDVNALYAFGHVYYRNAIILALSGTNDWSSTLSPGNWSSFHSSAGLRVILSELTSLPTVISSARLRMSYALTGNSTRPYQLHRTATLAPGGRNGYLTLNSTLPAEDLLQEETRSLEVGADIRLFRDRFGIDLTRYQSHTVNQTFAISLPVGSGASEYVANGGDVTNSGVEVTLSGTPVQTRGFAWNIRLNFSRNVSTVTELHPEISSDHVEVAANVFRGYRMVKGKLFGEVYARGFLRDSRGRVLIDGATGLPRITPDFTVRVANYNPDWLGAIQSVLTCRDFSLSFLVDIRRGGSIASLGNAIINGDGLTEATLRGREGGLVFGDNFFAHETAVIGTGTEPSGAELPANTLVITSEAFWTKVGGHTAPVGEVFSVDASNIRLREVVLSYSLPGKLLGNVPFSGVIVSLVGRNLFFLQNKAGNIDPEVTVGTDAASWGYDAFGPPGVRSWGFHLSLGF